MNFLTVDLYKDFQCIGGDCPDTCCVGWGIVIDEDTYRKMEEQEAILEIPASDWIMKKGDSRIVRLDHSRCPMLDEDNLCRVVRRLGSEYLSSTCSGYPRVQSQYGDVIEGHLTFSCPEVVARLMDKTELQFDYGEDKILEPKESYPYEQLYLYESVVRIAMVDVFQNPVKLSLHTRAALAFDILEKAIERYKDGRTDPEEIKEAVAWCFQDSKLNMMEMRLHGIVDENSRYRFLQEIRFLLDTNNCSERFMEMIREMNTYFASNDLEQYLKDIQNLKNIQCGYGDFHIRYWVCHIFSDLLSIPEYEKARENFMYIAACFCLAQMMALVVCVNQGTLDRNQYIYIISNISRKMEHNKYFKMQLMNRLDENKINGLAGLLLMII